VTAIVILGMHRSGTSCLAGMLAAAGVASAGEAIRNWDNARGHHEMLEVVRLDEAVLAYSGGHWLSPPPEVRWTEAHAAQRDRLLADRVHGLPALLKDPRMLLALPFWRASRVPFQAIAIVRHPLAVARSLESWRGMPLADAVALWTAHNRALAADRAIHSYPLIDFEQPRHGVVAAVASACARWTGAIDREALASAYDDALVHHDDGDAPIVAGLDEAIALYEELRGAVPNAIASSPSSMMIPRTRPRFPREELTALEQRVQAGDRAGAVARGRVALAAIPDAAAVLVPIVTVLVRHRAFDEASGLVREHAVGLDPGLADLLHGKIALAAGDATRAVRHFEAACAVGHPYFQARHLLPQALRAAGRHAEARTALERVAHEALYPHGPLATLAEWSWLDGDRVRAIAELGRAIAAAPPHRRGRLRTRRAEWLVAHGDREGARAELLAAIDEDPGYARSRNVLAALTPCGT
jgi:tetratricopeptide (TPR) repeat protein